MRPHTRTRCADGKECKECNRSLNSASLGASGSSLQQQQQQQDDLGNEPHQQQQQQQQQQISNQQQQQQGLKSAGEAATGAKGKVRVVVELPAEIVVKILNYLSFKEICRSRLTSRRFNEIGVSILNSTFQKLQSQILARFQAIKGQMPRRESARRNHPLAREWDIVETLHMRLTLLQMTFGKHIERKHVCFFAGEILDEVHRILRYVRQTKCPDQAYNVTDELFDLSTMAMEYFKEHIEPTLPEITYFGAEFLDFATPFSTGPNKKRSQSGGGFLGCGLDSPCSSRASVAGSSCSEPWSTSSTVGLVEDANGFAKSGEVDRETLPQSNMVLRKRIRRIRMGMKKYNDELVEVKRELRSCKTKMDSQTKQVQDYSNRLEEYDKKFEESSRKFQTLLTELNKCKTELQYWRSKSAILLSLPPTCSQCDAPILPLAGKGQAEGAEGVHHHDFFDDMVDNNDELRALANQGVYPAKFFSGLLLSPTLKLDAAAAEDEVQINPKGSSSSPNSPSSSTRASSAARGSSCGNPPSPPCPSGSGSRKRGRSRDDAAAAAAAAATSLDDEGPLNAHGQHQQHQLLLQQQQQQQQQQLQAVPDSSHGASPPATKRKSLRGAGVKSTRGGNKAKLGRLD